MQDVFEWMLSYGWALWLVLFLGFAAVEALTLDLFFGMLSVGALAAMIASLFAAPLFLQVVIFALVSVLMIGVVRPLALKHLRHSTKDQLSNIDRLLGAPALTLEPVSGTAGTVKLGGETWSARSADSTVLPAGVQVSVARIDGATAVVEAPHSGSPAEHPAPNQNEAR
ncbi:NfeD family protein [Arthrobacter zhangbolii]|uniref:NfeD family protein n=1 Tax=Arthrobacter zhangbolii TaxID=2886936 RepID=A0A9X1M5Y3_9MICC|nr:NfeD family protein [Arthrobacter zhangbolii]MCC3271460.1 NfeD family protein [Arthrobacter zhangbolii]MCC3293369.1 NfeD family protein [Arthrobacter zhangbolii]UON90768.1 NfeD family protein [Arthrobacter zhangbolii]